MCGNPIVAQQKWIRLGIMRLRVRSLASLHGWRIWGCRELWCRSGTTALIHPLAWEPPYAMGVTLKKKEKKKPHKSKVYYKLKGLLYINNSSLCICIYLYLCIYACLCVCVCACMCVDNLLKKVVQWVCTLLIIIYCNILLYCVWYILLYIILLWCLPNSPTPCFMLKCVYPVCHCYRASSYLKFQSDV